MGVPGPAATGSLAVDADNSAWQLGKAAASRPPRRLALAWHSQAAGQPSTKGGRAAALLGCVGQARYAQLPVTLGRRFHQAGVRWSRCRPGSRR